MALNSPIIATTVCIEKGSCKVSLLRRNFHKVITHIYQYKVFDAPEENTRERIGISNRLADLLECYIHSALI